MDLPLFGGHSGLDHALLSHLAMVICTLGGVALMEAEKVDAEKPI